MKQDKIHEATDFKTVDNRESTKTEESPTALCVRTISQEIVLQAEYSGLKSQKQ